MFNLNIMCSVGFYGQMGRKIEFTIKLAVLCLLNTKLSSGLTAHHQMDRNVILVCSNF